MPCFLKNPAFCPSSENEFSQVPASPPAMRKVSSASAAQLQLTSSSNAESPRKSLGLGISFSFAACLVWQPLRLSASAPDLEWHSRRGNGMPPDNEPGCG